MSETPRNPRSFSVKADHERPDAPVNTATRAPRAFNAGAKLVMDEDDYFETEHLTDAPPPPPPSVAQRRGARLFGWALSALGVVLTLALGLWFEQLVRALFERHPVLGQIGLAAIGLFLLAVVLFVVREVWAMARQRSVDRLRARIETALDDGNAKAIGEAGRQLRAHFAGHPKTATGRAHLAKLDADVIDAEDRYRIIERELLEGLDAEARALVMNAAKRVSIVTAVSPRALVDVGYVLFENVRLMRVIAEHYGGRAGTFGTIALVRRVIAHLAVTGSIALGDSLVQQLVGHGVAARLSARLGEGVVNGLLTARVGLAAIGVCRPAPFVALPAPRIGHIARELTRFSSEQSEKDDETKPNDDDKNRAQ